jgi:2-succinyl-6-hydroxy-2,4-cyclohexadiene-1-carboxylate synthase
MAADLVVDTGDARIHVEVRGEGQPIMIVHGFTGAASAVAVLSERLEPDYRVIVPDLVGHGRSSVPSDPFAYRMGSVVRQLLAVADVTRCATFHLVGYSMGGRIALNMACDAGHRLRSMTLIGATAGIVDDRERAERRRVDEDRAHWIETDFEGFVDDWMSDPLFASQERLGREYRSSARNQRLANDPAGLAASLRGAGTGWMEPLHDRLRECTVPTLLVVGEEDEKFLAVAADLSRRLPRSSTAVIAGAGHAAHVEQPDAVAGRIRELVSGIEGS